MTTAIVITSTRRFIADALAQLLQEHRRVAACTVATNEAETLIALDRAPGCTLLIDLDAPSADPALMASIIDARQHQSRRGGFYDTFTSGHAEAAFALSVTVLIPLSSQPDQIVHAALSDDQGLRVTPSEGLSRRELERLAALTPREIEVLGHIARGHSTRAIAHVLGITTHTVNTHKRRTFDKLEVQSQSQAVALAARAGVIEADIA